MFKYTSTYEDFNGNKRTEDFRFNLTEQETTTLTFDLLGGEKGDFESVILKIISEQDENRLLAIFRALIDKSYGEISADGKYFFKDEEILRKFKATNAYSDLYMKLGTDSAFASEFVNKIFPSKISVSDEAKAAVQSKIEAYIPGLNKTEEKPAIEVVK